ncbi:Rho-binding antiterminator [Methylomonas sp. SURF-1]|uniref:Rho-binding antiterminator n=1 Tax=Methylomonas aurea TaxID=2952224 RepID=A0ABT1UE67_9GAMM|nr:Rho-binding antiterminator [Methylomonas sp. SURF-1]MCQ8179706.1 Rho-binding antiterminator [Methylomonas sp. SURF-1]
MTQPIACNLHDYLEIACIYGYRVKLTLTDGSVVAGKAVDTVTTADKREYLQLDTERVETNRLAKLEVLTPGAKFKEVLF